MDYNKSFIVGCPRSGTTWVKRILNSHPGVVSGPESHAYQIIIKPFLRGLDEESGWQFILEIYEKLHDNIGKKGYFAKNEYYRWIDGFGFITKWVSRSDLQKYINIVKNDLTLTTIDKAQRVVGLIFDNYFVTHSRSGSSLLVEKTPGNIFFVDLIMNKFPEAKIIEVIRDGRDVCVSMEMRAKTQTWGNKEREDQATRWRRSIEQGERLRANKKFAQKIFTAKYENLKNNTEREISKMFKFVNLECSLEQIAKIAARTDFKNFKNVGPGKHYWQGKIGSWREYFSKEDIKLFKKIAGDTLKRLGYEW